MDDWAWEHSSRGATIDASPPVGPFLCVLEGLTRGRSWSQTGARGELRRLAAAAGVRRRFAPHQYADILVMSTSLHIARKRWPRLS